MSVKVCEVMSRRVVTIPMTAPVVDALRLMLDERISGIPVTAPDGSLAGMLTEGDFLRRSELGTAPQHPHWLEFVLGPGRLAAEYVGTHGRQVSEVMTRHVISIDHEAPLAEAVRLMEQRNVKRLPVLDDGKLVGILSRADLVRAFVNASRNNGADTSDSGIRGRIADEIERQNWSPRAMVRVGVADGVAHLHGVIFDDRLREALRVLVENVPGVKQVHDHLTTVDPLSGFVVQAPAE